MFYSLFHLTLFFKYYLTFLNEKLFDIVKTNDWQRKQTTIEPSLGLLAPESVFEELGCH